MDRVIVKDVSGSIQKHDCQAAEIRDGFLFIKNNPRNTFAYNMQNLISWSIQTLGTNQTKKEEK